MGSPGSGGVAASAPGKVLLVGGYLVLQDGVPGLVLATSARFHSGIAWEAAAAAADAAAAGSTAAADDAVPVHVASPQFHAEWHYTLPAAAPAPLRPAGAPRNPYVECAVNCAMAAAAAVLSPERLCEQLRAGARAGRRLRLICRADNDFYSQRQHLLDRGLPVTTAALATLPPFMPCPRDAATGAAIVAKTGLGSSAALVTSVVAAVLQFMGAAALPARGASREAHAACEPARRLVHAVAQVAHGLAQGKIGSGFDVCAATYGSICFARIPGPVVGHAMEVAEAAIASTAGDASQARRMTELGRLLAAFAAGPGTAAGDSAAASWSFMADEFTLPRGLALMLADVSGGSGTPGMVRQVLAWRDKGGAASTAGDVDDGPPAPAGDVDDEQRAAMAEAWRTARGPRLWRDLAAANARVGILLRQLQRTYDGGAAPLPIETYDRELVACAALPASAWPQAGAAGNTVARHLTVLHAAFGDCRRLLRQMGVEAGVAIEPPEQTSLADATLAVSGVVAAGVPGAGGYDAMCAVILEPPGTAERRVRAAVEAAWLAWPGGGLTPLLLTNGAGVREPDSGVLLEPGMASQL